MINFYVWGCSDDLIELTGDIEDEFSSYAEDKPLLLMSDGTVLQVCYDREGNWRFLVDNLGKNTSIVTHAVNSEKALEITNGRDYSEVAEIQGDIEWVAVSSHFAKAKK